MIQELKLKDHI